jgi:cell division protein FtsB
VIPRDIPVPASPPTAVPAAPPRAGNRGRRIVRFVLASVTAVVLVDAVVGENGVLALMQKRREYAAVERALQQARDDNAALLETTRRLRVDPGTIESAARRDLGLIKPGEKVFIIKDAAPPR